MKNNRNFNSIIAIVAIIVTVFVMHISSVYISEHAGHRCEDQAHCPVCAVMNQCETNLKTIGSGIALAVGVIIATVSMMLELSNYEYQSIQTTLVSQKVRMDS